MKMNSGVETETERTCEEGGGGKTEPDTLQGKPHARPYPTRGSITVLFPILLYFRAVGCVCSRPEQLWAIQENHSSDSSVGQRSTEQSA